MHTMGCPGSPLLGCSFSSTFDGNVPHDITKSFLPDPAGLFALQGNAYKMGKCNSWCQEHLSRQMLRKTLKLLSLGAWIAEGMDPIRQICPHVRSGGHQAGGTKPASLQICVCTEGEEMMEQLLTEWLWGRKISLCVPHQTRVSSLTVASCAGDVCKGLAAGADCSFNAVCHQDCCLWPVILIWLAHLRVGWGAAGTTGEQVKANKDKQKVSEY